MCYGGMANLNINLVINLRVVYGRSQRGDIFSDFRKIYVSKMRLEDLVISNVEEKQRITILLHTLDTAFRKNEYCLRLP